MDFTLPAEVEEAAGLATTILTDHATADRMTQLEAEGARFDPDLWAALEKAGLLELAPTEGADLGFLGLCRFLVEVGRTVAPVPAATDGVARLVLSEVGLAAPDGIIACAIAEEHDHAPTDPTVVATADSVLTGTKYLVPAATVASHLLVTATSPDGPRVFLVPTDALAIGEQTLSDEDVVGLVELDAVSATPVGDGSTAKRLTQLATVATCAVQLGVTEGALRLTAQYAKDREQFDRPIATFQAVAQRLADGYIDTRFQGLTMWEAAWRLSEGLPADEAVATAKLWAADAGHRLAHTAMHIHGGVGIDLDGVAHRYFTAATRFEAEHGGATHHALQRGRLLAHA